MTERLSTGDTIEYGMTIATRSPDGKDIWLRAGATISVRTLETEAQAKERLSDIVEGFLLDKADEWEQQ